MRIVIKNTDRDSLTFAADFIVKRINAFQPSDDKPFTMVLPNPSPLTTALYNSPQTLTS